MIAWTDFIFQQQNVLKIVLQDGSSDMVRDWKHWNLMTLQMH